MVEPGSANPTVPEVETTQDLGEQVADIATAGVFAPMIALGLAIVFELICLLVLRYQPMRDPWRARLVAAWYWSAYAVFLWAFVLRFGERGGLDWRAGDAPWVVGLGVGVLLMAYGIRWIKERQAERDDELQSALN